MARPYGKLKMTEGEELFYRLQGLVVETAIPQSEQIKFDKRNKYDFFLVASYLSTLEKAWAVLALVDRELGIHSLAILRSQLDTFADLRNLLKDPTYLKHLELRSLQTQKDRFIAAKNGNPYLKQIAERINTEGELSVIGEKIKKLVADGAKILSPSEKMQLAELKAEHEAIYPHLSDNVHGGLSAMQSRHLKQVQDDFEVVAFPVETKDDCIPVMLTAFDIVLRASSLVHLHFKTGYQTHFDDLIVLDEMT